MTSDGRVLAWSICTADRAATSCPLPISEELFLLATGSHQRGHVHVTHGHTDHPRVDVRARFPDPRALPRLTLARLDRGPHTHGIGIFYPPAEIETEIEIDVDVVFTLPAAPLLRFSTHTARYAHTFHGEIVLDALDVHASNAHIRANSVTLARGTLASTNGHIAGHFNVAHALTLRTSNANVDATAALLSTGTTRLELHTTNAHIASSVSLTTPTGEGGDFAVTARSTNGAIDLRYDDAPPGARLASDVRTSNGPASVAMHPAFEGRYEASTSNAPVVVRDTRPVDPSGERRRRRILNERTSPQAVSGVVSWQARGGPRGTSAVHSSNARVTLDL